MQIIGDSNLAMEPDDAIDDDLCEDRINRLMVKEAKAIENWAKLKMRLLYLKSIRSVPDDLHASEKDAGLDDEALKPKWYESGTYIIKPNTVYFKFWLL